MHSPRPISPVLPRPSRNGRSRGFTVPELSLAALVLLLAAGLALTGMERMRQRGNRADYIRDLRGIAAVFESYHRQNNRWPPSSSAEIALPPDLARALAATAWFKGSPFGGNYALGWIVCERKWGGGKVLTHNGSNTMNYSVAWVAPKRGFAVLVCVNQGGDEAARACDEAASALIRVVETSGLGSGRSSE